MGVVAAAAAVESSNQHQHQSVVPKAVPQVVPVVGWVPRVACQGAVQHSDAVCSYWSFLE